MFTSCCATAAAHERVEMVMGMSEHRVFMAQGWLRRSRAFECTSGVAEKACATLLARHQSSPRAEPEQSRKKLPMKKALSAGIDSWFDRFARGACLGSRPQSGDSSGARSAPQARKSSCAGGSGAQLPMRKASVQGVLCRAQQCVAFRARGSRCRVQGWCLHAYACQAVVQ